MKRSEFNFIDKLPGRMPEFHAFNFLIGIIKALRGTPTKITYRLLCIGNAKKASTPFSSVLPETIPVLVLTFIACPSSQLRC